MRSERPVHRSRSQCYVPMPGRVRGRARKAFGGLPTRHRQVQQRYRLLLGHCVWRWLVPTWVSILNILFSEFMKLYFWNLKKSECVHKKKILPHKSIFHIGYIKFRDNYMWIIVNNLIDWSSQRHAKTTVPVGWWSLAWGVSALTCATLPRPAEWMQSALCRTTRRSAPALRDSQATLIRSATECLPSAR